MRCCLTMHGLIEAGEQEFNVRPFALTWLVDFGVGRYYGKISDGNPAFLRNEIHQPAEADKVSQQLLDIKVIPVHRREGQYLRRGGMELETQETQTLAAIGGTIHVAQRIEYDKLEFVERLDVRIANPLDHIP